MTTAAKTKKKTNTKNKRAKAAPAAPFHKRSKIDNINDYLDSDEKGDAELFALKFKSIARYDHSAKKWYLWRAQYWEEDVKREVIRYASNGVASEYLAAAADELEKNGNTEFYKKLMVRAKLLRSLTRTKHVLEYAQSEPEIALSGCEWDSDPDLLPVNNGVIDLRTGVLRNALPDEYIRRHSPVDWKGIDEPCPLWEQTLEGIYDNDKEMISFDQRLSGYMSTGHVTEHKLPIFLGEDGRNGKTVMFETKHNVLGDDLCITLPMQVLMKNKYDTDGNKPEPYLAKLAGKRLAYASESAEDMNLNSATVKKLSGGDRINARGLNQNPNEFKATHKLALFTNRKPAIPPDDQAVWDRLMLIELKMRFVDDPQKPNERKRDKNLGEKLKAEYPGILAWLVRGAIEWRMQGLNPPDKVTVATTEYRNSEDILQIFIDERIAFTKDPNDAVQASTLYFAYKNWASAYGLHPIKLTAFGLEIKKKFENKNVAKGRNGAGAYIWTGIKL